MKENIIKAKTFLFALKIVGTYRLLSDNHEYVLSKQLLRSGTAIGALVREAEQAESKADFVHKLAIAQKEANETEYWLELLVNTKYLEQDSFDLMNFELSQIKKLLSSILVTTKQRLGKLQR